MIWKNSGLTILSQKSVSRNRAPYVSFTQVISSKVNGNTVGIECSSPAHRAKVNFTLPLKLIKFIRILRITVQKNDCKGGRTTYKYDWLIRLKLKDDNPRCQWPGMTTRRTCYFWTGQLTNKLFESSMHSSTNDFDITVPFVACSKQYQSCKRTQLIVSHRTYLVVP